MILDRQEVINANRITQLELQDLWWTLVQDVNDKIASHNAVFNEQERFIIKQNLTPKDVFVQERLLHKEKYNQILVYSLLTRQNSLFPNLEIAATALYKDHRGIELGAVNMVEVRQDLRGCGYGSYFIASILGSRENHEDIFLEDDPLQIYRFGSSTPATRVLDKIGVKYSTVKSYDYSEQEVTYKHCLTRNFVFEARTYLDRCNKEMTFIKS